MLGTSGGGQNVGMGRGTIYWEWRVLGDWSSGGNVNVERVMMSLSVDKKAGRWFDGRKV